jgi:hypothetical protein
MMLRETEGVGYESTVAVRFDDQSKTTREKIFTDQIETIHPSHGIDSVE